MSYEIDKKDVTDHIKIITSTLVAAIPVVGGPISNLINEYVPSELETRRTNLIENFDKDIKALKDQCKAETLESPEYTTIVFKVFKNAIEEHDDDIIKAYRAILQNSATINLDHNFEIDYYIKLLNELTITHIYLLKLIHDGEFFNGVIYTPPGDKSFQDSCIEDLKAKRLILSDKETFGNTINTRLKPIAENSSRLLHYRMKNSFLNIQMLLLSRKVSTQNSSIFLIKLA